MYTCTCMYVCMYVHTYYVLIKPPIPYIASSPLCLLRVFASFTSRMRTYFLLRPRRCVCFVFLYVYTYICIYVCMYIHMYICTYVYMYVCTYTCIERERERERDGTGRGRARTYRHIHVIDTYMCVCVYDM